MSGDVKREPSPGEAVGKHGEPVFSREEKSDLVALIRAEAKKQTTLGQAFDMLRVADALEARDAEIRQLREQNEYLDAKVQILIAVAEKAQADVVRLGSFLHPVGVIVNVHEGKNYDAENIAEVIAKAVRGE